MKFRSNSILFCLLILTLVNILKAEKLYVIDGKEYTFSFPVKRNWFQAVKYCAYFGSHLVEIETPKENQAILSIINDPLYNETESKQVWTSATDLGSEGCFYWISSGIGLVYSDWSVGQPDNAGGNEHCVEIRSEFGLKWNDHLCELEKYFICEKPSYN